VFQTLGANRFQLITRVIFPYALPSIWNAMRLMLGAAWTFVVIAEIVGASSGLGHRMIEAERYLRTDQIFAVIIVIGCLGFVTDYLFKWGHTRLFPWATKSDV
ncbi:MAG: ABC transporter permease subunit, partial [Patescibacteria group bacterium]